MTKATKTAVSRAPKGLSKAAQTCWKQLLTDYPVDDSAGLLLLETAMRCFDRAEEARRLVDAQGAVLKDRFGQSVPHPALKAERDARGQMMSALKSLNLDVAPVRPPHRPVGS